MTLDNLHRRLLFLLIFNCYVKADCFSFGIEKKYAYCHDTIEKA